MKKLLFLIFFAIVLILTLFLITNNNSNPKDFYVHTKAICNQTNYCQDYEIECQGNQVMKMTPITGAFLQQSKDWQDPRTDKDVLCK